MTTYAIGDVQGCYDELSRLLDLIQFNEHQDCLWFAGDLVNRGPKSLEVMRLVMSLPQVVCVLGNHDLHCCAISFNAESSLSYDTLDAILSAPDRDEIIHWLLQQPLIHSEKNWTLVHAGIPPQWTLDQTLERAHEVESVLRSDAAVDFFKQMYGNQPDLWNNQLTGWDRLRCITNHLTRMRYCTEQGKLNLTMKATQAPKGYAPWFSFPNQLASHEKIIFGHWAALQGKVAEKNIFAIDTGCVWGGKLTALRLDDLKTIQIL